MSLIYNKEARNIFSSSSKTNFTLTEDRSCSCREFLLSLFRTDWAAVFDVKPIWSRPSSAASLVSSRPGVSSDTAVPAAWISKQQSNYSCHTWWLASAGAVFSFASSLAKLQQPINLERRQKKKHVAQTDEWGHLKIWWQINKSSITGVQDEGPPRASCGGWPTVSDAQSHDIMLGHLNYFLSQSQRRQSLPTEAAVDVQMLLPPVLPTALPASLGHKSHQLPGWEDPEAPAWGPRAKTSQPATKVTAVAWECDHYCKETRVFGNHSKNMHPCIPECIIYLSSSI